MAHLFARFDIDLTAFDFFAHVPMRESKGIFNRPRTFSYQSSQNFLLVATSIKTYRRSPLVLIRSWFHMGSRTINASQKIRHSTGADRPYPRNVFWG